MVSPWGQTTTSSLLAVLLDRKIHRSLSGNREAFFVESGLFRLVDLAFQVGRGLVPLQLCFDVLTAGTRESTRSRRLFPPEAGKADGNGSWDAQL